MKDLASRGLAPADLQVVVLSPDPWPAALTDADESKDAEARAEAGGDRAQHALLYGRYLGQVQARIERVDATAERDRRANVLLHRTD